MEPHFIMYCYWYRWNFLRLFYNVNKLHVVQSVQNISFFFNRNVNVCTQIIIYISVNKIWAYMIFCFAMLLPLFSFNLHGEREREWERESEWKKNEILFKWTCMKADIRCQVYNILLLCYLFYVFDAWLFKS